jgi:hypothetical protein
MAKSIEGKNACLCNIFMSLELMIWRHVVFGLSVCVEVIPYFSCIFCSCPFFPKIILYQKIFLKITFTKYIFTTCTFVHLHVGLNPPENGEKFTFGGPCFQSCQPSRFWRKAYDFRAKNTPYEFTLYLPIFDFTFQNFYIRPSLILPITVYSHCNACFNSQNTLPSLNRFKALK